MLAFTLATPCLIISNLPWFMDVTFQISMHYCSLEHQTLLLSPVTSTTVCCFCFGSVSSFFLELFLHWSPVASWAPTNLGSSSFSVLSFCLFILFMGSTGSSGPPQQSAATASDLGCGVSLHGCSISIGAQYATGYQWRKNSKKNERMEPKQKQHPVVNGTGDGSRVRRCNEQYCIGTWNVRSMNQGKLEVVKQEMARVNVDILEISELKWTGMG